MSTDSKNKPFLRWAGGKNWLIKYLVSIISESDFNNYHEPFLGGGSIFFSIRPSNGSFLSDLNSELIGTYITLRNSPEELIKELGSYKNNERFYYKIRDSKPTTSIEKASRFIYLNQTSFNGIYRVNLKGDYNVPYGYRKKDFFDPLVLRSTSDSLRNSKIFCGDFSTIEGNIKSGDLIYLDPPYIVSHGDNGFIKYNQKLFSLEDQFRLCKFIDIVKNKGAFYILSNAFHPKIREIFNKGDYIIELKRASLIGGKNAVRGKISEYLFTNIKIHSNDR